MPVSRFAFMTTKELYDRITAENPCGEPAFIRHLDSTVRALESRYGKKYVYASAYQKPLTIHDDISVYDEYFPAIVDNILFLITKDTDRKTDFIAEADYAYKTIWGVMVHGKRFMGV